MQTRTASALFACMLTATAVARAGEAASPTGGAGHQPSIGAAAAPVTTPPVYPIVASNDYGPGIAVLKRLPADQLSELKKNGVVLIKKITEGEGSTGGNAHAVALFDRDADSTLRLLTDTSREAEYVSVLNHVEVIKKTPTSSLDEQTIKVLGVTLRNRVQHYWDLKQRRFWFELDKTFDNSFKHQEGYWTIYPLSPARCVAVYGTKIDVGIFVPQFVQDFLTEKDLPKSLGLLRAWVNSGGRLPKNDD